MGLSNLPPGCSSADIERAFNGGREPLPIEEEMIDLLERYKVPQKIIDEALNVLDKWITEQARPQQLDDYEMGADELADELEQARINAKHQSKLHGCVQHVNQLPDGHLVLSDWSDSSTVASFQNGVEL